MTRRRHHIPGLRRRLGGAALIGALVAIGVPRDVQAQHDPLPATPRSPGAPESTAEIDRGLDDRGGRGPHMRGLSARERFEMRERLRSVSPDERRRLRAEVFGEMTPGERERLREQMFHDRQARQRARRHLEPLSAEAREALRGEFGRMSRDERRRLREQLRAMEPEDRRALRKKLSRFRSLTDTEQQELRDSLAELRSLDAGERARIESNARRFREDLSETERERMRGAWRRLKRMEPEERARVLDQLLEDGREP